jgi:hypothetical protein
MHTLSFHVDTAHNQTRDLPWLHVGMQQLLDIAKASSAIIRDDDDDDELCASIAETIDGARFAMEFLFQLVPNAPHPLVTANAMTGDITILFEDDDVRLELIVHNEQRVYSCLKTHKGASAEIDDQELLIKQLQEMAA